MRAEVLVTESLTSWDFLVAMHTLSCFSFV
jgi:hypothetical protein